MDKNAFWKWLTLFALILWSLWVVWPVQEKITLGLDLQGGYSFILEVDDSQLDDNARKDAQERALEVIRNRIDISGTREPIIYPEPDGKRIVVQLPGMQVEDREPTLKLITEEAFLTFRMVHENNDQLTGDLLNKGLAPTGYEVVTFTDLTPSGQPITLTLYKAIEGGVMEKLDKDVVQDRLHQFHRPSAAYDFMLMKEERKGQNFYRPFYVSRRIEMTGDSIENARVDYMQLGQPVVGMSFDSQGAEKFGRLTDAYRSGGSKNPSLTRKRQMAIILDDRLYSAPQINDAIYGGSAQIEGSFSLEEATKLSVVLRAGALPAPLKLLEERLVDPTLGKHSVTSGVNSLIYGAGCIILFMVIYYQFAGVVVTLALALDALLLPLGAMIAVGFLGLFIDTSAAGSKGGGLPTLTLPGIAGLVLTIGMAVDANVLIFERIREEQREGRRFSSAVTAGYEKVFSTILDANVTTLLVAIILFWQGSGPIRGFAVTLTAGIIVSMYTALVFTRMLFDFMASKTNIQHLRMLNLVRAVKIDFLGKRKLAAFLSLALILGTMANFVMKGKENLGVDFTGGRALTFEFTSKPDETLIRNLLTADGADEIHIQFQKEVVTGDEVVEIKVATEFGDAAKSSLELNLVENGVTLIKDESVGPQIGKELRKKGVLAIVCALVGIVLYISVRFEFAFAMGAIVALIHDILITVGVYCLFGRQLSLPIIAALLTIVGYSVNDTIVVFDRIREDLKLIKHKPYMEIANLSINKTLSRTLLTSLTTLITVVMLLIFGGGAINDFALALLVGIIVGTYSSIFVATPVMLLWHKEAPKEKAA